MARRGVDEADSHPQCHEMMPFMKQEKNSRQSPASNFLFTNKWKRNCMSRFYFHSCYGGLTAMHMCEWDDSSGVKGACIMKNKEWWGRWQWEINQ